MIITILSVILLIALLLCLLNKDFRYYYMEGAIHLVHVILTLSSFFTLVSCLTLISMVQIPKNVDYEKMINKRDIIEYRLELIENGTLNNTYAEVQLYADITDYNQIVIHAKRWSQNPFTSWFHNELIGSLDIIEFKE